MRFNTIAAVAAVSFLAMSGVAQADVVTYNTTPVIDWGYGNGNNYDPSNSASLFTDAGDELNLRIHNTGQKAPASVGKNYHFALGPQQLSFDWGYSNVAALSGVTAFITLSKLGTANMFNYDVNFVGNDNYVAGGRTENSFRFNWPPTLAFNPLVDSTYNVKLTVNGLAGGPKSLDVNAVLGAGAVPEPATWAMMIMGFGGIGATIRSRRRVLATA